MFNYAEMAQFWGQLCTVCIKEFVLQKEKMNKKIGILKKVLSKGQVISKSNSLVLI